MRFFRPIVLVVASLGAGLSAAPAYAHHALDAMYDTSSDVQAMATLAKVEWINPHAWMRFHIVYPHGAVVENVMIETLGLGSLRQQGISRETLEIGKQYAITFYPTRNGQPGGFMTRLLRPDGAMVGTPGFDPNGDGDSDQVFE